MQEELKVLFYLKKNQVNASGLCSVMGRITIGLSMAQFSAKIEAEPSKWDAKAGRMTGKSNHALQVNRQIDKINLSIHARYKEYLTNRGSVTAEELKNAFQGIATTQETLLKVFVEHNEVYRKRIGIDREKRTYQIYCNACSHLSDFLQKKYRVRDMSFNQLTFSFIEAYDFYLRVDLKMKPNTVLRNVVPFRKIVRIALNKGFITRDPFTEYKPERGRSEHRTLTSEELQKIMDATFESQNRTFIRDLFVFSSFCGLAFADLRRLTEKELVTTEDGKQWIVIARKKTGTISRVRLLDIPLQIIEKYKKDRICEKIFSVPGYSTVDINLKRIAEICGINKTLTYHQSRHTFASVVCLSQGVPIETVSRMLGHKDIHTTQIYATVSTQKISDDMKNLSERMAGKFSFIKSKNQ